MTRPSYFVEWAQEMKKVLVSCVYHEPSPDRGVLTVVVSRRYWNYRWLAR